MINFNDLLKKFMSLFHKNESKIKPDLNAYFNWIEEERIRDGIPFDKFMYRVEEFADPYDYYMRKKFTEHQKLKNKEV